MKRKSGLLLFLFVLSGVAGFLLSKASWVGRAGISLFYQQYKFLKVWWQAGLLVFVVWLFLFGLQGRAQRRLASRTSALMHVAVIVMALIGLYFTYQDFHSNTAHRWLGERFHLGGYLFWVGWIIVSVFYLSENKETNLTAALAASGKVASEARTNRV